MIVASRRAADPLGSLRRAFTRWLVPSARCARSNWIRIQFRRDQPLPQLAPGPVRFRHDPSSHSQPSRERLPTWVTRAGRANATGASPDEQGCSSASLPIGSLPMGGARQGALPSSGGRIRGYPNCFWNQWRSA
jgi:hypothetical protein